MTSWDVCKDALSNVTSSEATDMFLYSGKNINDLGKFESCEQSPKNAYYILHLFLGDQVVRFYTGKQKITNTFPNYKALTKFSMQTYF